MTGALSRLWNLARPVLGGTAATLLVVVLVLLGRLDTVEFWALSKLYDVRGAQATTAPVVIVTIDESSINEIGKWPFPRTAHATLLQKISEGGPLAFGGAFQGTLSGLDNLKFICRIYGADFRERIEFVQEFSELGHYLREPVKTYSSGMRSRLAFAISMAVEFDCFLIDEIIATWDYSRGVQGVMEALRAC